MLTMSLFTTLWSTKFYIRTFLQMISLVKLSLCDSKSAGDTIDQLAISGKFVDFSRQRRQDVTTVRSGLGFYV